MTGSVAVVDDGQYYNRMVWATPDGELRYRAGSIAIHALDRDFVRRMAEPGAASLPFHRADKKIPTIDAAGNPVRPEKRDTIPAVTHVDGSGRLQTVSRDGNGRYWALIDAFRRRTGVPVLLKNLVDAMDLKPGEPTSLLVVPVALLLGYGLLRLSVSAFTELRELVFAKATQGAARYTDIVYRPADAFVFGRETSGQRGEGILRGMPRGAVGG